MNRYSTIQTVKNINENVGTLGDVYYKPNYYPEIPLREDDIYVLTDVGDRLDLLANQFYQDPSLYWIIACANPDVVSFGSLFLRANQFYQDPSLYWIIACANPNVVSFGSLFLRAGAQLRIPINTQEIIRSYINLNNV